MTRKWNIVNDQSNTKYSIGNEIIYNKEVLKSNLFDQNDAYILLSGEVVIAVHITQLAFKNCAPLARRIRKLMKQKKMMLRI